MNYHLLSKKVLLSTFKAVVLQGATKLLVLMCPFCFSLKSGITRLPVLLSAGGYLHLYQDF
jgi:hypothetical protein